ncbi:hypothetical protein BH11PAT3_BH11PAT3_1840 [soil metagenome]
MTESNEMNINFSQVAEKLTQMLEADQLMRKKMREGEDWDKDVDNKNTHRLKEIIKEIGWPTISKVGKEASLSAWIIVQHADFDLDFQIECLDLMRAETNDVRPDLLALLEDRVMVNTKGNQLYGTQFYTDEKGIFGPRPIEDIDNLTTRRNSVGLIPFAEYETHMRNMNEEWVKNHP